MELLIDLHTAVTFFMVGLIWFVQIVHYPLMGCVVGNFAAYEAKHTQRTGWIVGPVMTLEAITAGVLTYSPPPGVAPQVTWFGLGLVLIIFASTVLVQVPCHRQLTLAFDAHVHRRLVSSNWIRTIAWTARGAVALWISATG